MRRKLLLGLFLLAQWQVAAIAAPQCKDGFQASGDVCISQRMIEYIYCVKSSGGNQEEVNSQIASAINEDDKGKASGSASGIILRGGGSLDVSRNIEQKFTNGEYSHYFSGAMKACLDVLGNTPPPTQPPTPVIHPKPPPPVVPSRVDWSKLDVLYWDRPQDNGVVAKTLKSLNISYRSKPGIYPHGTDIITCTSDVPVEAVRSLALALLDAGVKLRSIGTPANNPPDWRQKIIIEFVELEDSMTTLRLPATKFWR